MRAFPCDRKFLVNMCNKQVPHLFRSELLTAFQLHVYPVFFLIRSCWMKIHENAIFFEEERAEAGNFGKNHRDKRPVIVSRRNHYFLIVDGTAAVLKGIHSTIMRKPYEKSLRNHLREYFASLRPTPVLCREFIPCGLEIRI